MVSESVLILKQANIEKNEMEDDLAVLLWSMKMSGVFWISKC